MTVVNSRTANSVDFYNGARCGGTIQGAGEHTKHYGKCRACGPVRRFGT